MYGDCINALRIVNGIGQGTSYWMERWKIRDCIGLLQRKGIKCIARHVYGHYGHIWNMKEDQISGWIREYVNRPWTNDAGCYSIRFLTNNDNLRPIFIWDSMD